MPILSNLASMLAYGVLAPVDSLVKSRQMDKKVAQMLSERAFWTYSIEQERDAANHLEKDWHEGERRLYPADLIPFFEENPYALSEYQRGMKHKMVIDLGFRPMSVPDAVFRTRNGIEYNPFVHYEQNCGADEDAWLKENRPELHAQLLEQRAEEERRKKELEATKVTKSMMEEKIILWCTVGTVVILMLLWMAGADVMPAINFILILGVICLVGGLLRCIF